MRRNNVHSTSIASIGYDPASFTLEIEFLGGELYQYFDVPVSVYLNFVNSESRGRFFNYHIKPYYRYHCEDE